MRLLLLLGAAVVLVAGFALMQPLAAQQSQSEEVDSAQYRVLERLRRLARPPGYDSILYVLDSLQLAEAAEGRRSGAAAGMDSIASGLVGLAGYNLTEYQGGTADFQARERILVLAAPENGRARVISEGMQFEADTSITFNESTGRLNGAGNATFTPPDGDPVDSPSMVYDLVEERGSAVDAQTSYSQQGAEWLVRGDMPFAAQDSSFMSHARFTSCEIDEPHYHFQTDEIKIVGGNVLVARGVRLYFADVPVLWLPFIAQSLSSGRSSGLLTPRFSVNDIVRSSRGYRRRISNLGFYWAMSDYSDGLAAIDWFSNTFLSLTGSLNYRFSKQFLDGGLSFRRYWREDGSAEFAMDTRHSWTFDERTDLRISSRFASSNDFVRENSFNPREVTQSIDSEGGFNRRFDWGALSFSANRKQYLSDDRTEWTLPSLNLSLSPITLLRAPPSDARFWNNMTWSGASGFRRSLVDRVQPEMFSFADANTAASQGSLSSNLSLGRLTFGQSLSLTEDQTRNVPEALLLLDDSVNTADILTGAPARDIAEANLRWNTSLNYQQQLIGSTTLTPRLSLSGSMFRSDTSSLAENFVTVPSRVSLGAQLKTDIYGFFPGVGSFETIRHKFSPAFNYQWSPESTPDNLQRRVFGSRVLQPKNSLSLTLNQTFEARREPAVEMQEAASDSIEIEMLQTPAGLAGEPRRIPQAQIVNLLSLRTSVMQYDFVEADSAGSFLQGFETTRLSNQLSSDILRGLAVSADHDLFEDELLQDGQIGFRRFAPHLSQVNLSFSLTPSSPILGWLGLFSGEDGGEEDTADDELFDEELDPFAAQGATDESSIVPLATPVPTSPGPERESRPQGSWSANLSYSLQRPRDPSRLASQMITGTVRLQPTELWELSWRTAYDLEMGAFNDHSIRLTRDLHRWQANFDFLQTATGNWSFRFEVSLMDNRDLKFDYDQQNLDVGLPSSRR
ncbi:MAG: hypothetical protein MK239_03955 [Gemmatimonadetes bacterium]|nr:hypothetical protein [Gemmatimonadota bacterium]